MSICDQCRNAISDATKKGIRKARANGVHVGRPTLVIQPSDLARVLTGQMTAVQLALRLGCSVGTIRRRLRLMRAS